MVAAKTRKAMQPAEEVQSDTLLPERLVTGVWTNSGSPWSFVYEFQRLEWLVLAPASKRQPPTSAFLSSSPKLAYFPTGKRKVPV